MPAKHKAGRRQPYYGHAELCELLGMSRQTLSNLKKAGKLPTPDAELRMGPVWDANRSDVITFVAERRSKEGGSRK